MDSKNIIEKFKKQVKDFNIVATNKIKQVRDNYEPKVQHSMNALIRKANTLAYQAKVMSVIVCSKAEAFARVMMQKAGVAYAEVQPVVVASARKAHAGMQQAQQVVERKVGKIHFNFRHFVVTSTTAAVVFALTFTITGFNRSKVEASTLEQPVVTSINEKALDVNYGDESALVDVAKDILSNEVSNVQEAKRVTLPDGTVGYEYGKYIIEVESNLNKDVKETDAVLKIQTKDTYAKQATDKVEVEATKKNNAVVEEGIVNTYKVKVNYVDTEAPQIQLTQAAVEINDVDNFHKEDYIASIVDNYDGVISDYTVEGALGIVDEERWEAGEYTLVYRAKDAHGNEGTASLQVKVNKTEEEKEEEEVVETKSGVISAASKATSKAGSYENAGSVASAAMAQIGVAQDCTALVSNSLAAVGIYFHDWPAGYMSLGTIVSAGEAQPGDIIYYLDGGAGVPHVAIYIGGGQAVHGGYQGTTKVASAYIGPNPVFIRIAR